MGKKKDKKKKLKQYEYAAYAAQGFPPGTPQAGFDKGLLNGLPGMLKSRKYDQFLIGAALGAAAAYVLSDEALRARLIKMGIKLYSGLAGGLEEFKEQMADLKAEVEAEQHGGA